MKRAYIILLFLISTGSLFGQEWSWINRSGSGSNNEGHDVALGVRTDNAGNVYVVYRFAENGYPNSDQFFDNDTANIRKYGETYLAKYDSSGNRLWARPIVRYIDTGSFISRGPVEPCEMEIDNNGFLYIAGSANVENMIFGNDTISVDSNITSSFVMKCDTAANPVWFRINRAIRTSNPNMLTHTVAKDICLDPAGNIFVSGDFRAKVIFGTDTLINSVTNNASNGFVAKYDNNGNVLWAKAINSTSGAYGLCVCSDDSGNVFVGGATSFPATFQNTTLPPGGFIIKTDPAGNLTWTKSFGYRIEEIMFDSLVFVAGVFFDSMLVDNVLYNTNGGMAAYVCQLSDTTINWLSVLDCTQSAYFIHASLHDQHIYLAGYYSGAIPFTNPSFNAIGGLDFLVAKYSYSGQLNWLASGGSPGSEQIVHITTDNAGRIYVCGAIDDPSNLFGIISANVRGIGDAFVSSILDHPNACGVLQLNPSGSGFVCRGDSILLAAPSGLASYLWSNGITDSTFYTGNEGIYSFIGFDSTGCFYQGNSYTIDVRPDYQIYTTPNDSIICFGSNATLLALSTNSTTNTVLWSTGATSISISVSIPGPYWITVTNDESGCVATDTINMSQAGAICTFNLPSCVYDTLFAVPSIQLFADSILDIYWVIGPDTIQNDTLLYPLTSFGPRVIKLVVKTQLGCPYSITHTTVFAPSVQLTVSGDTLFSSLGPVNQWLLNGIPIPGATGSYYVPTQTGNYSVINTFIAQCADTSASFYFNPTWITESSLSSSVSLSPNPGSGIFILKFDSTTETFSELIVTNALGKEVFRKNMEAESNKSEHVINCSDQPAGLYSLRLLKSNGTSKNFHLMIVK